MAFNPMNITLSTSDNGSRYATLWYDFDWKKPKYAYDTKIPLGNMSFKLNDGLVHVISIVQHMSRATMEVRRQLVTKDHEEMILYSWGHLFRCKIPTTASLPLLVTTRLYLR